MPCCALIGESDRSKAYGIELQTSYRVQDIAGNIIPAIATTNAIIAGSMVLECLKVVDGRFNDCKVFYRKRTKSGSKGEIFLTTELDEPSGKCVVCGGGAAQVTLNVDKTTLKFFLEKVLRQGLQMEEPSITVDNDNFIECIADEPDFGCLPAQPPCPKHVFSLGTACLWMPSLYPGLMLSRPPRSVSRQNKFLSDPSIKISHNSSLSVEDDASDFQGQLTIAVVHR